MYGNELEECINQLELEIARLTREGEFDNRYEIERLGHVLDSYYADLAEWDEEHGIGP